MKTKHISFNRKTAFGSVAVPMFGARVVNEFFRKTENNQSKGFKINLCSFVSAIPH